MGSCEHENDLSGSTERLEDKFVLVYATKARGDEGAVPFIRDLKTKSG
jgi:hypothetical protein